MTTARHLLAAACLAATAAAAPAQTLLHDFSFTDDAKSIVNGAVTAAGTMVGDASIVGGALHLQGSTAYVDLAPLIPVAGDFNQSSWTVSVWARQNPTQVGELGVLVGQGAYAGYLPDYQLGVTGNADGTGQAQTLNRSGWSGAVAGNLAEIGQWNLYTTIMYHFEATLYLNGQYIGSNAAGGANPCCFTSQAARIGRQVSGWGGQFNGDIDDVRIYSGSLGSAAILAQYQAGPSTVSAVPEPASLALMLSGLLVMGGIVRHRHPGRSTAGLTSPARPAR